jgi:anthranilate synthase component 1
VQKNVSNKSEFTSSFQKEKFMNAVNKTKEYISSGDVMQVVLSQRLSKSFEGDPISMYEALRDMNPSPYMYFLDMDDFQIIGSSPEILVKLEDKKVTVRPIAGTRPRGKSDAEDLRNETDLLSDPKELAEHLMLIDLGRNDIGRISKVGSVELTEKMIIERYSHVMHIVSNVNGQIEDKTKPLDVLRATFPAGTVSGAPKIRAMEIINELEPLKRGIYSGAIGYLSWTGDLDTALSIRTAVIKDDLIHVQAGAGIVHDSVPETEWDETMNKAMALLKASEKANIGNNEDK